MKKYLIFVLVFILFGLSGCTFNMTKSAKTSVDQEEFAKYLTERFDIEDLETFACEFKFSYKLSEFNDLGEHSKTIKMKGKISNTKKEVGLFYKADVKEVYYELVNGELIKYTLKLDEKELLVYSDDSTSPFRKSRFHSTLKSKYKTVKESYNVSKIDSVFGDSFGSLDGSIEDIVEDVLGMNIQSHLENARYYIDKDACSVIFATHETYIEVMYVFDYRSLKGMKVVIKHGDEESIWEYVFKDIGDIRDAY